MVNRPKAIGTRCETLVTKHLHANGFPHAERRALAGAEDRGDVLAHLGVIVEVKGGQSAKTAGAVTLRGWLAETERERKAASADFGLLVVQRINRETPGPGGWDCYLPMWALVRLVDGDLNDSAYPLFRNEPVRVTFDAAIRMLRVAGYGDALAEVA